jgi:hypothetical protein
MSPDLEATRRGSSFVIYSGNGGWDNLCMQRRTAMHSLLPEIAMPIRLHRISVVDAPFIVGALLRAIRGITPSSSMGKVRVVTHGDLIMTPEKADLEDKSGVFLSREDLPPLLGGTLNIDFQIWFRELLQERMVSQSKVMISMTNPTNRSSEL